MRQENITKGEMAKRLKTSRAQVDRLLDPKHNPSLSSLTPRYPAMSKPLVINKASTQLAEAMKEQGITAIEMAKRLKTSGQVKSQPLAFQPEPSCGNRRAPGEIDAHLTPPKNPSHR